jgi:hypothetical protein
VPTGKPGEAEGLDYLGLFAGPPKRRPISRNARDLPVRHIFARLRHQAGAAIINAYEIIAATVGSLAWPVALVIIVVIIKREMDRIGPPRKR